MNATHPTRLVLSLALTALLLSACVISPHSHHPPGPVVIAPVPPPSPHVEVVPALPYPGAVWISGYWGWARNRHEWVPGRYERPRPGYRWEPHRWHRQPRGDWRLEGGRWDR